MELRTNKPSTLIYIDDSFQHQILASPLRREFLHTAAETAEFHRIVLKKTPTNNGSATTKNHFDVGPPRVLGPPLRGLLGGRVEDGPVHKASPFSSGECSCIARCCQAVRRCFCQEAAHAKINIIYFLGYFWGVMNFIPSGSFASNPHIGSLNTRRNSASEDQSKDVRALPL